MASIWENAVITNAGLILQAKLMTGGTITVTTVKSGSGTVEVAQLKNQTAVSEEKQTASLQPMRTEGSSAIIPVLLSNTGVSTAYDLRQIGFYATDPDEGEILYAIAQNSEAKHIPAETEMPGYSLIWNFYFSLSNDINMSITVDPSGMATLQDVTAAVTAGVADKMDKANPTGTGAVSINRLDGSFTGNYSVAVGYEIEAHGEYSVATGYGTVADSVQTVIGKCNTPSSGPNGVDSMDGSIFIVGNGNDTTSGNALRTTTAGKTYGLSSFASSGADYAEMFEILDGNSENEDWRGYFVTLDGGKIKKASPGDYILGVVSSNACFLGDTQSEDWHDKYLKDVFGEKLTEIVDVEEFIDNKDRYIPAHTEVRWILNPDYDPGEIYVNRESRPEWVPVGMLGKLIVIDDGSCEVNGYCTASSGGIATTSSDGYRVIERIDESHIKVIFK